MEVAQRLEAKRRRREMAEKRRVTDATIGRICLVLCFNFFLVLMQEVYNQISFMENLKFCINAFHEEHQKWAETTAEEHRNGKASKLSDTQQKLLERIR